MNEQQVETIKQELTWRKTQDLVEIWQLHNREEWTEEAFEAIRQILLSRLDELPYQDDHAEAERRLGLAQKYLDLGEPDRALEECDLAVRAAPHFAEAYNARGMVLDGLGRLDEAIASYEEALKLDPGSAAALKNLTFASKEKAEKERIEIERIENERRENEGGPASKPSGYFSSMLREAWTLVRRNKSIWALCFGYVVFSKLNTLADILPLLGCLVGPVTVVASLLFTASIIQIIHNLTHSIEFRAADIWNAARKSFFRLLGLMVLTGFALLPILLLVVAGKLFYAAAPIFSFFLIGSGVIFGIILIGAAQYIQIELVLHADPVNTCLTRGIKIVLRNIGRVFVLSFIIIVIETAILSVALIPAVINGQNLLELFTREGFNNLINSPLYPIVSSVGVLFNWSIGTSATVLLYHRITSAEQKGEIISTNASNDVSSI